MGSFTTKEAIAIHDAIISIAGGEFKYEVALNRREGYILWNKFGYNTDVDVATGPEVVAAFGGSFTPLKSSSTLDVVSSDINDSDSGGVNPQSTGARTIRIVGLDENRDQQTEDVILDGTTSVTTSNSWLGINRAIVLTTGSSDFNEGVISITATTGGSDQAIIPAGEGVTQQLIFFTPKNHSGLFNWLYLSGYRFGSGTEPVVTFKGWVYSPITDSKYEIYRGVLDESVSTDIQLTPSHPFALTEQDVFWIEVETTRDNTSVYGRLSIVAVEQVES